MSVNLAVVVGHLGKDPETRYTAGGDAVCNFSIATSERWKDKSGEKREKTEWHNIVCFGRQAEIAGEYLKKGSLAGIEGKIQTRKWQDKEGNDRYSTEIVCGKLNLLSSGGDKGERAESAAKPAAKPANPATKSAAADDLDDDIPF